MDLVTAALCINISALSNLLGRFFLNKLNFNFIMFFDFDIL